MLAIGMIGLAHPHADAYADSIARTAGARLASVWDEDAALAADWSRRTGCPPAGLPAAAPDVVVALAEPSPAAAAALAGWLAAWRHGGSVMMCEDSDLAERWTRLGARVAVCRPLRHLPAIAAMERWARGQAEQPAGSLLVSVRYGRHRRASRDALNEASDLVEYLTGGRLKIDSEDWTDPGSGSSNSEPAGSGQEFTLRQGNLAAHGIAIGRTTTGAAVAVDLRPHRSAGRLVEESWRVEWTTGETVLTSEPFAQSSLFEPVHPMYAPASEVYWGDSPFDGIIADLVRSGGGNAT